MAIDPSIPLGGQPLQIQSPFETVSAVTQLAGLREQNAARRLASDAARQKAADEAAIRRVLTETGGDIEQALPQLRTIAPRAALEFETEIAKQRKETFEGLKAKHDFSGKQLDLGIKLLQGVTDQRTYDLVRPMIGTMSPDIAQAMGDAYDPARVQQFLDVGLTQKDIYDRKTDALKLLTEGKAMEGVGTWLSTINPQDSNAATLWDQAKAGAKTLGVPDAILAQFGDYSPANVARAGQLTITPTKQAELTGQAAGRAQTAAHQGVLEQQGAERIAIARQRALRPSGSAQTDREDVDAIADAIIKGDQPPVMTGLYRYAAPVRAALAKNGYNLATAQTDWAATQKHVATLNNSQQTRMAQGIDNAAHSLDVIEGLAKQWGAGRFPLLNSGVLKSAKAGVLGPQAQQIATSLEAQISDVTAELGNVYMGGNSPTDHALALAGQNLSASWSRDQLLAAVTLARTNLRIRQNSMRNVGVAGASATNPYAAPAAPATPPPVGRFNPTTGKVEPVR